MFQPWLKYKDYSSSIDFIKQHLNIIIVFVVYFSVFICTTSDYGLEKYTFNDFSPNKSGFNSSNMAWLLAPTLTHFLVVMTEQNLHFLKRVSCLVHNHPILYHHEKYSGQIRIFK